MTKRKRIPDITEWQTWKVAAQAHADELGLLVDLWTETDDYDLVAAATEAFARGDDAEAFIEEAFEEDLARMEGDADDFARSLVEEGDEET